MNIIRNDYGPYTVTDFLNDQEFLAWVKYPNAERNDYWAAVAAQYPQQEPLMQKAKAMILLLNTPVQPDVEDNRERVWSGITTAMQQPVVRKISPWRNIAAAASVLLVVTTGYFIYQRMQSQKVTPTVAAISNEIKPGKNVAVLTLANGQQVLLDSTMDGVLAKEGSTNIRKTASGQLVYEGESANSELEVRINRIDIPRGGHFRLTLPDGTKVWLNAATSLEYPSAFIGKERSVTLTGEAYFEVVSDAQKPFRVISGKQTLEVLGTNFNINSYEEEDAIRTTLLEGSVRLTNASLQAVLKPGQQAAMFRNDQPMRITAPDTEEVMAWKEGYFIWNKEPLESIMRKLARWYDIQPVYEKPLLNVFISGIMSRSKNLSEVLANMEMTGSVHFRIEGRKVYITK